MTTGWDTRTPRDELRSHDGFEEGWGESWAQGQGGGTRGSKSPASKGVLQGRSGDTQLTVTTAVKNRPTPIQCRVTSRPPERWSTVF